MWSWVLLVFSGGVVCFLGGCLFLGRWCFVWFSVLFWIMYVLFGVVFSWALDVLKFPILAMSVPLIVQVFWWHMILV